MQRFKSIIYKMQGKSKTNLQWLYNTKSDIEPPKIFLYCSLRFWFGGLSIRNSEKMLLFVELPTMDGDITVANSVVYEHYLLAIFAPAINKLSESYLKNTNKSVREKAQFAIQKVSSRITKRNGIRYNSDTGKFILRINFNVPLVNSISVNSKATFRAVKDIMKIIEETVKEIDTKELQTFLTTQRRQTEIREYLKAHNLCAFLADGSILPRENGTDAPMKNAVPFGSPEDMRVTIPFFDGTTLSGMGIRRGVTVITGGGYSGKSTMLDAIEMGIYNHAPGDGREYVITDDTALKIDAEDGRPVHELDLSPFFKFLPGGDIQKFSTLHASGSVSQAANIVEAVYGGAKLLLIDEDKSATNFMIRDRNMRLIVKNEPIIPFTDRVLELNRDKSVSTILVIGGSSEYLTYADTVILMDDYLPKNITGEIGALNLPVQTAKENAASFTSSRVLLPRATNQPFLYFKAVKTENEKKIILDDYSSDITHLSAVVTGQQMNMLSSIAEQLLCDKESDSEEIMNKIRKRCQLCIDSNFEDMSILPDAAGRFYEAVRPLDVFCCISRMRGVMFTENR